MLAAIARHGLQEVVRAPGFVDSRHGRRGRCARALCMLLPSRREGYGLVVVEAAAQATPQRRGRGRDNAAIELVEEGVNGVVAPSRGRRGRWRGDRARARGGRGAAREHGGVVRAQRASDLRLESSLRTVLDELLASARA